MCFCVFGLCIFSIPGFWSVNPANTITHHCTQQELKSSQERLHLPLLLSFVSLFSSLSHSLLFISFQFPPLFSLFSQGSHLILYFLLRTEEYRLFSSSALSLDPSFVISLHFLLLQLSTLSSLNSVSLFSEFLHVSIELKSTLLCKTN